jgi:hypothetical protein
MVVFSDVAVGESELAQIYLHCILKKSYKKTADEEIEIVSRL